MVKKVKSEENLQPAPSESKVVKTFKKAFFRIIYISVAVIIVYGVWTHPEAVDKARSLLAAKPQPVQEEQTYAQDQQTIADLSMQVQQMQNQLMAVQNNALAQNPDFEGIAKLNERLDSIEKQNINVIDSKADVAVVLGLVTRLDAAEKDISDLNKISDENALILTAAMLVKESADQGGSFIYEAEILKQLAENRAQIKDAVNVISKVSVSGIHTKLYLINEFESIYASLLKEQKEEFEKTWKDRLNSKLNEIIKVKRVNDKNTPEFKANEKLELVKKYVDSEEIVQAVAELEKPENMDLLNNEALKTWFSQAKARVDFSNAISKISAYSLATMKVNFIKKGD